MASRSTIYRAKETVVAEMFSEDPWTIRLLPSFLIDFQQLNPRMYTEIGCYKTAYFRRAIMVMNPGSFVSGQGVYGVDAGYMKHRRYNGIKILLVGRDGNFSNQVAAVSLAPIEYFDNYASFFKCVIFMDIHLSQTPLTVIVTLVLYRRRLVSVSSTCIASVTLLVHASFSVSSQSWH